MVMSCSSCGEVLSTLLIARFEGEAMTASSWASVCCVVRKSVRTSKAMMSARNDASILVTVSPKTSSCASSPVCCDRGLLRLLQVACCPLGVCLSGHL